MRASLQRAWYAGGALSTCLLPLAWLYGGVIALRRAAYRHGLLRAYSAGVPVLVVGNITVGGSGKTPLVAWCAKQLRARGRRPGIVSRGYGGKAAAYPMRVHADSDPAQAGDEPVLLAAATGCPVAVAPDRVAAARLLVKEAGVDLIIADDGLQHYRLSRDCEIAVRDGRRGYGNGRLLPAGPLREPRSRLVMVDAEFVNGPGGDFDLHADTAQPLIPGAATQSLQAFAGQTVHAVAGIGHPQRFFDSLRMAGLDVCAHPFPDHHAYRGTDVEFGDDYPVLMTEKDAVKCRAFASAQHYYVPVSAQLCQAALDRCDSLFDRLENNP